MEILGTDQNTDKESFVSLGHIVAEKSKKIRVWEEHSISSAPGGAELFFITFVITSVLRDDVASWVMSPFPPKSLVRIPDENRS